jgi:hypothetical protein
MPATAAAALWLMAASASALELGLPLACTPGEDCWLVRLVDHDPGPAFADHRCGNLGSNGHNGTEFAIADPVRMAGVSAGQGCGEPGAPLWAADLHVSPAYDEVPLAVVGLTDYLPERDAIVAGTARAATLSTAAPALVGYVLAYGLRPGDRLEIAIIGPDGGKVSEAGFDLDEAAPRATRAAGRRRPAEGWAAGTYRVEATVRRGARTIARGTAFTLGQ